jgi:hypothetical protein
MRHLPARWLMLASAAAVLTPELVAAQTANNPPLQPSINGQSLQPYPT